MDVRQLCEGLTVSEVGLGCAPMSGSVSTVYGAADEGEAEATLRAAIEVGITFFDTAEAYGRGSNEELLAKVLRDHRDQIVIGTKFGFRYDAAGAVTGVDGSPAFVRRSCEEALRRLQTETLDLLYMHRMDPASDVEETIGALGELVGEGKVRHIGLCEVDAPTLRRAHAVHPIAVLQSEYSLWERGIEDEILPTARELGVGLVPFSPLGRGFLAGVVPSAAALSERDLRRADPRFQPENLEANTKILAAVQALAEHHDVSPARIALAWLMAQGDDIVPIPGAKRQATMLDSANAVDVTLTPSDLDYLEAHASRDMVAGERLTFRFKPGGG